MRKFFEKIIKQSKTRFKDIFNSDLSAKQIAVNFTVGILIGLLIPMGLQTVGVVALCALFRLNFVVVVFATLITNPFTVVFIYYSAFKVGDFIINSGISWASIDAVLNNPEIESILSLSISSLKVIYTGLIIESLIFGTMTYFLVYYISQKIKTNHKLKTAEVQES